MFSACPRTSSPLTDGKKQRTNPCIIGDAILPQNGTKLTKKCASEFGALLSDATEKIAIWVHNYTPSCTLLPKYFGKFTSYMTFGAYKLVRSEPFLDSLCEI